LRPSCGSTKICVASLSTTQSRAHVVVGPWRRRVRQPGRRVDAGEAVPRRSDTGEADPRRPRQRRGEAASWSCRRYPPLVLARGSRGRRRVPLACSPAPAPGRRRPVPARLGSGAARVCAPETGVGGAFSGGQGRGDHGVVLVAGGRQRRRTREEEKKWVCCWKNDVLGPHPNHCR
jgi:hypothetical protein